MNKLDMLMKLAGCIVVALITVGLVNPSMLSATMPFIIAGAAAMVILYMINAFKKKNYPGMITTLILGVFILAIVLFR